MTDSRSEVTLADGDRPDDPRADDPVDGSPAGRSRRPRRHTVVASAAFAATAAAAGVAALIVDPAASPPAVAPPPKTSILAPADGSLSVAGQQIAQMEGSCDSSGCFHVPPAHPVLVKAGKAVSLPLKAGRSTLFSVGAYNPDRPSMVVPLSVDGSALALGQVAPGSYLVTVSAIPNGGVWQFELSVPKG